MRIFNLNENNLTEIKEKYFNLEKDMQKLTENNLNKIFNLKLVRSEFELNNLRIDTLAFDEENKSFVIIEFKNDKNFSVIDQGYAYLSLMLNNKADFILEYNENSEENLKREDVDWSQSKVIFVAPKFTYYQQRAIHFKDLPIELWEISIYEQNLMLFNQLKTPESSESINTLNQNNEFVKKVSTEIKTYTEEEHLDRGSDETRGLYQELKEKILNLGDDIEIKPRKWYLGFKKNTNFLDVEFQRSKLKLYINLKKGELNDTEGFSRDVSEIGHWGNGDYEIYLEDKEKLDYIIGLIQQSYDKN